MAIRKAVSMVWREIPRSKSFSAVRRSGGKGRRAAV
jgi:hypothetical protein